MKLTSKQKEFCRKYVEIGNAQKAYKQVYKCSDNTAKSKAYIMLKDPRIVAEIHKVRDEAFRIAGIGTAEIIARIASIARGEVQEEVVGFTPKGEPIKATKQVTPKDQLKALELLGKRYGIFKENINVNQSKPIKVNIMPMSMKDKKK